MYCSANSPQQFGKLGGFGMGIWYIRIFGWKFYAPNSGRARNVRFGASPKWGPLLWYSDGCWKVWHLQKWFTCFVKVSKHGFVFWASPINETSKKTLTGFQFMSLWSPSCLIASISPSGLSIGGREKVEGLETRQEGHQLSVVHADKPRTIRGNVQPRHGHLFFREGGGSNVICVSAMFALSMTDLHAVHVCLHGTQKSKGTKGRQK